MLRVTVASFEDAEACPLRNVLDRLGDKWSLLILTVLEDGPQRFNEIKRLLGDISQRVLAQKLRHLERDGYVSRKVHDDRSLKVVYALTEMGQSSLTPIMQLMQWAIDMHPQVRRARIRYDNSKSAAI